MKFDCPICEGRIIKPGVNDLQTLYPEAVAMYDTERNEVPVNQISPKNVLKKYFGSANMVIRIVAVLQCKSSGRMSVLSVRAMY